MSTGTPFTARLFVCAFLRSFFMTFQNKIITEPQLYKPYLLAVKISESCILLIQF